jgi:hypothetical protein
VLTPALQSIEISRRVPHSVHYCDPLSTHVTPLESPERCLGVICSFFEDRGIAQVAKAKATKSE